MDVRIYDFNSFGRSHKSIGVDEVVEDAIKRGVDTLCVISSGNYIATVESEVERRGLEGKLRIVNLVNRKIKRKNEITIGKNRILRNAAEREAFVREKMTNAGIIADYTDFQPAAYKKEAENILATKPDYISIGVGSGKLFLALRECIHQKGLDTKLIGILPLGENGIFNDENLYEDENGNLYFKKFNLTSSADKLTCLYTYFKPVLLETLKEGHRLIEVSDKALQKANKHARRTGYNAEVSGSAGFVTLDKEFSEKNNLPFESKVVVVNTGRGYNWEQTLRRERFYRWGIFSTLVGTTILIGSLIYNQRIPSGLLNYADLDKNGNITQEELYESHLIAGTYDWNADYEYALRNYQKIKSDPQISKSTLLQLKQITEDLREKIKYRSFREVSSVLSGLGGNKNSFEELSFDQLCYLKVHNDFEAGINPELLSAIRYTNTYNRLSTVHSHSY